MYQREMTGIVTHPLQDASHLGRALRINSSLTLDVASVKCRRISFSIDFGYIVGLAVTVRHLTEFQIIILSVLIFLTLVSINTTS